MREASMKGDSDVGTVHYIEQGDGSEQQDPLILFALGQHANSCATDDGLLKGSRWWRFLTMKTSQFILKVCNKRVVVSSDSCGGKLASVRMRDDTRLEFKWRTS